MLKTIIRLPDGTEISSGSNAVNAIQSVTLTECVNSGEDLTIGSTCANALEMTLITPGGVLDIPAGTRVTVLKQDGNNAPVQVGVFNLEKPTRPSANRMKLTGYDRVAELDKDLTDWLHALNKQEEWNYTLTEFASMVCSACGLTFKVADVPNAGFPVPRFTRSAVTGRQIMQWLGEICCRFCRADAEGNIEFAWYKPSGKTITPAGDLYYMQNSLSYENYKTAAVDAVQLRLTNSTDGVLWPVAVDGVNSYIIIDNAILNVRLTEDALPYLQVIQEELATVQYTPCKVSLPACLDIHAGHAVDIVDKNGVQITAYVMTKTQSGQKDTLECTGNQHRDSTSTINNQAMAAMAAAAAKNAFSALFTGDINMTGKFESTAMTYLPPTWDDAIYTLWSVMWPADYPLPEEYDFDLNGDGRLDEEDAILAMRVYTGDAAMGDCPGAVKTKATIRIDMSDPEKLIHIFGTNMWGTHVEIFIGADINNCSFASRDYLKRMINQDVDKSYLYRTVDGETEYFNPPLDVGEEYRTTERFLGKPVYTKLVDCGEASNGKTINHNVPSGCSIIRFAGTLGSMPLPINWDSTYNAHVSVTTDQIKITLGTNNYAGRQVYVQLWYTKE